jgi:hypothetical protein
VIFLKNNDYDWFDYSKHLFVSFYGSQPFSHFDDIPKHYTIMLLLIVRIANGMSESEGMVEVLLDGQWGYICDDKWDYLDANVVCRSLGYSG